FTAPYDVPLAHIPCGQILQGASTLVFCLDVSRSARRWGQRGMAGAAGLDARLLIGAENVIVGAQGLALPHARIEVQNQASLLGEVGLPRKDPVLGPPRFDGIGIENPPHCATTDWFAQPLADPCPNVGEGLTTQRLLGFGPQFTSDLL